MQTKNIHGINDKELFKNHEDYWQVADNIRDIYMSDGSLTTLLDFERVLDEMDIYAFKNWEIGELVAGPDIGKYTVGVTFMWPEKMMPDPRGGKRLLPFDARSHTKSKRSKSLFVLMIRQTIFLAPKKPASLKNLCGWWK